VIGGTGCCVSQWAARPADDTTPNWPGADTLGLFLVRFWQICLQNL